MLKSIRLFLVVALAGLVVGCASTPGAGQTPEQAVFASKSAYAVALNAAVAYRRLPVCRVPPAVPCHDAGVLAQLQKADNVAAAALDAAENAVRSPSVAGEIRSRAITAAQTALAALTAITTTLRSQ